MSLDAPIAGSLGPQPAGGPLIGFEVRPAAAQAPATPLVFASPHSGRHYPQELLDSSRLDAHAIRRSEDAHVDALLEQAPAGGAALILALVARAYIDINRDPWELDPGMFSEALPAHARSKSPRVAAGLGAIPKVVGAGREIYRRKLRLEEATSRIDTCHHPYHQRLEAMLAERRSRHGRAILLDWHSMPSAAARPAKGGKTPDIVLGDRFGAACATGLTALVEAQFQQRGYLTARNAPYAGGYTTERHGRPASGIHALQIEINRAIYLDEASLEPNPGLARLATEIGELTQVLARDWAQI